jgi:hypothetical protein
MAAFADSAAQSRGTGSIGLVDWNSLAAILDGEVPFQLFTTGEDS